MAIVLSEKEVTASLIKYGVATLTLGEKKGVTIKTGSPTSTILDVEVPDGKTWRLSVEVRIDETDA